MQMFQHVLCVYPYRRELNRYGFFPPLGLEFIGAVIEPYTRILDIIDLRKESGRSVDFLDPATDMVCFSVNWNRDARFLREEILSIPSDIYTILGGRHATEDPEGWLAAFPNVDAVVRGDGEEVMEELCRGLPHQEIQGLSFRKGEKIFHNPNRHLGPMREDIFPNRRLRRYSYEVEFEHVGIGVEIDTVSASRGCPYNCTFCSFNRNPWGMKREWTGRSPDSILAELSQIEAPIVGFTDDLFNYDLNRVEQICDLILARGIRKKYLINARLELARRPDILDKMERAGFAMLLVGVESAQDKTLRSMRKGLTTSQIRKYFSVLREKAMILHGYFILGNIGESAAEMEQMIPFAHELGLDTIGLTALRANPWSGLQELIAQNPAYHIAPNKKIYSDHCSAKDLKLLRRKLQRKFYSGHQVLQILRKGYRSGILSLAARCFYRIPQIAYSIVRRIWQRKKKRRAESRRMPTAGSSG
jgi:radical SAM superfamily enzyme YgiQ (UPF0313 family)